MMIESKRVRKIFSALCLVAFIGTSLIVMIDVGLLRDPNVMFQFCFMDIILAIVCFLIAKISIQFHQLQMHYLIN